MIVNSSLVRESPKRKDVKVINVEASALAEKIGHIRYANMVALGAVAKATGALQLTAVDEILRKFFPPDKHKFVPENVEAIRAGYKGIGE
jgi:2-oxoglutarate ferredoxin oxidoreductase subunit gamma